MDDAMQEFREQVRIIRDMADGALTGGELDNPEARQQLIAILIDEVLDLIARGEELRVAILLLERAGALCRRVERE